MAEIEVSLCDECLAAGKQTYILPAETLGDDQGGPVRIGFPGYSQELELCAEHVTILRDRYGNLGRRRHTGATAVGSEMFLHLAYKDAPKKKSAGRKPKVSG